MDANPLNDREFRDWLRGYWYEWRRIMVNSCRAEAGREPATPSAALPFLPLGRFPAAAFERFFTRFITDQLDNGERNATMVTILGRHSDRTAHEYPYIAYEPLVDGHFQEGWRLFHDCTIAHVRAQATNAGQPEVVYEKYVSLEFLRQLHGIETRWRAHEDRPRFLVEWFAAVWAAFESGDVSIRPQIPFVEALFRLVREHLSFGDLRDWTRIGEPNSPLEHYLVNLTVDCPEGEMKFDLHLPLTLEVCDESVFSLLNLLRGSASLNELYGKAMRWAFAEARQGNFALSPCRGLSRLLLKWAARRTRMIPAKVELLSKIIADPMRIMIVAGDFAFLLTMDYGRLSAVRQLCTTRGKRSDSLRYRWLTQSQEEYVHLAVQLKSLPFVRRTLRTTLQSAAALPGGDPLAEIHPNNEFVRRALRTAPLRSLVGLLVPFARE